MGGGLIGDDVDGGGALEQRGEDVGGVADHADRQWPLGISGLDGLRQRIVEIGGLDVQIALGDAPVDAGFVDVDADRDALVHGDRQRLSAAHATDSAGQRDGPRQAAAELLLGNRPERLVGPLQDALGADVDPRAGRHLAVHRQALGLQLAKLFPIGPVANQIGVRDQYPRRPGVRTEHPDRLAGLHQHGLVVFEPAQSTNQCVEGGPAARCAPGSAIDDEIVGVLGDLGIEVVHQHAQDGFLLPSLAGEFGTARRANGPGTGSD